MSSKYGTVNCARLLNDRNRDLEVRSRLHGIVLDLRGLVDGSADSFPQHSLSSVHEALILLEGALG